MRKLLLKILLFCSLCFILDQAVGNFIEAGAKKYDADQRLNQLLAGKLKKEVFVLGSSKALNNINAKKYQELSGKSTFNLAFSGSNVEFHAFLLKLICDVNKDSLPQRIIYHLDGIPSIYFVPGIEFRNDVLFPHMDHELIGEEVCKRIDQNVWAAKISPSYRNSRNLFNGLSYYKEGQQAVDYTTTKIDGYGSNILTGNISQNTYDLSRLEKINKEKIPSYEIALKEIVNTCEVNGIELQLVSAPYFSKYDNTELLNTIASEIKANKVCKPDPSLFFDTKYFYNSNHMNSLGANKFTTFIYNCKAF